MSSDSSSLSHGGDTPPRDHSISPEKSHIYNLDDASSYLNALPISDRHVKELSDKIMRMQFHIESLEDRIAAHELKEQQILSTIRGYRSEYPVEPPVDYHKTKDGTEIPILDWGKSLVYEYARDLTEEPCYAAERIMLLVQCLDRVADTLGHEPEHSTEDGYVRSLYVKKERSRAWCPPQKK